MQEAFVIALERWPGEGAPANPGAWITQVARNRAIDRLRREGVLRDKIAALERLDGLNAEPEAVPGERLGEIEDDRLRLVFTCCHPALALEAREAVLLEDQDRSLWDEDQIAEGLELSREAAAGGPAGPYTVQARIAAAHAEARTAAETDWARIVRLYAWHLEIAPGPVVELNRAVAVAMCEGPERGLELIEGIEGLDGYQPLHTARADLLRRLGRPAEAAESYRLALPLSANPVERRFIERRLESLLS